MSRTQREIEDMPVTYSMGGPPGEDFTIHVRDRDFSMSVADAKALFANMFQGGFAHYPFAEEGAKALYAATIQRAKSDIVKNLGWLLEKP